MDFKKMLEYNSPKNLHKRLMGLNNIQKVIMLPLAPCFIVFPFSLASAILEITMFVFGEGVNWDISQFFFLNVLPPTLMLSFALYLFQSKK